ncbi:MAG: uroporphyrinogen decarboxylase [Gemmatimonadales bacterium]
MNERFLRACRRVPVDRPPIWLMRQAGRYLPEYRALRERVDFLTLCKTPELAVEASLQPLRRFPLDAAIVFSDILIPVEPMGCALSFNPGPRVDPPIRSLTQVEALRLPDMADAVPFVGEAIALLARELDGKVPVIGFAGAPFTLAAYLVEGQGGNGFETSKALLRSEPETFRLLLDRLANAITDYLAMQIHAGAQAVQLFDSWAGILSPGEYRDLALPAAQRVIQALRPLGVPVIYFAVKAGPFLEEAAATGADVLGVCWRTPLAEVRRRLGDRVALQGNLDPHVLLDGPAATRAGTQAVLDSAGRAPGHIMNLGHGILPNTPIVSVAAMVETVLAAGAAA